MFVNDQTILGILKLNLQIESVQGIYLGGFRLNRKAVRPILDCLVNPKGALAYIIFDMTNENFNLAKSHINIIEAVDHLQDRGDLAILKKHLTSMYQNATTSDVYGITGIDRYENFESYKVLFNFLTKLQFNTKGPDIQDLPLL